MYETLSIITIANLVFLAIVLLILKSKVKQANLFLAITLLFFAIVMLDYYSWMTGFRHNTYLTIRLVYFAMFVIGFSFYLYVLSMTGKRFKWKPEKLVHFIPAIPALVFYIHFQLQPTGYKLQFIEQANQEYPLIQTYFNVFYSLLCYVYFFLAFQELKKYSHTIKACFSSIESINLKWLKKFIIVFSVLFIVISAFLTIMNNNELNIIIGQATVTAFYLVIFIKTVQHPSIYNIYGEDIRECIETGMSTKQTNKGNLYSEAEINKVFNLLNEQLEQKKMFLKSRLSLKELADSANVHPHLLSHVINRETNSNFNSLINRYRVEESKKQLLNPENNNLTIEAIGLKCGFNSASSFFDIFKNITGMSPKKYRKNNTDTRY